MFHKNVLCYVLTFFFFFLSEGEHPSMLPDHLCFFCELHVYVLCYLKYLTFPFVGCFGGGERSIHFHSVVVLPPTSNIL